MGKYIKVTSNTGFANVRHFEGELYVPFEDVACETCEAVGGYCGHCSGHCWSEVVELPPEPDAYRVVIDSCPHCEDGGHVYTLTESEYAAEKPAYDAPWHECTSGPGVSGGGACCAPRGHRLIHL